MKNRLQTCLDFVKKAEDIHEHVPDCIENANTLLTKWFYKKKHEVSYRYVHDFCDDHREIDGRRWQVPEAAGIDVGWVGGKRGQDGPCHDELQRKTPGRENNKGNDATSFGIGTRSAGDGERT